MSEYIGEFFGTALLILLGDGVVAGTTLNQTKAKGTGWVMIAFAWGLAVTIAVYITGFFSPAHLNPAVTLAFAVAGKFPWAKVLPFIIAQVLGAFVGACLVWLHYYPHWAKTTDAATVLGCFATIPAIRHTWSNFLDEVLGTMVLVILIMATGYYEMTGFAPLVIGLAIVAIGFSLGPTTGYAINPARDLGPRLAHFFLPIANKGDSDWGYAWIPIVGPIVGGILGVLLYQGVLSAVL